MKPLNRDDSEVYKKNGKIVSQPLARRSGNIVKLPAKLENDANLALWQNKIDDPNSLIAVDLFCGAGGLSLGFEDAGFFIASGVDYEENAVKTHGANFASKSIVQNITEIENPHEFIASLGIPRVDLIIGGPPCQGFSRAIHGFIRSKNLEEYYYEILNSLYREYIRFVEALEPRVFVMENVPDMAIAENGTLITRILDSFRNLGYRADYRILDAVNYDVPQRRRRLFVIGNKFNEAIPWPAPRLLDSEIVTLREAISDLPQKQPPQTREEQDYKANNLSEYQQLMRSRMSAEDEHLVYDHIIRDVREDDKIIFALMEEGQKYTDVPEEYRRYRSDIFKDKYSKLEWDEPAWTVTAHIRKDAYRYIHPDRAQGRMLSIREFARIQSFPDHFRFCGAPTRRMQQIGNAVPPILAQHIGEEIYSQIVKHRKVRE